MRVCKIFDAIEGFFWNKVSNLFDVRSMKVQHREILSVKPEGVTFMLIEPATVLIVGERNFSFPVTGAGKAEPSSWRTQRAKRE